MPVCPVEIMVRHTMKKEGIDGMASPTFIRPANSHPYVMAPIHHAREQGFVTRKPANPDTGPGSGTGTATAREGLGLP